MSKDVPPPVIFRLSVVQNHMETIAEEFKVSIEAYSDKHPVPDNIMRHKYMAELACESIIAAMQTLGGILENDPER